jgi:hypothetical protein
VLEQLVAANDALAAALVPLGPDDDRWSTLAEAPPGHIPLVGVALHALWDSWTHERDIVLPLGLVPTEEDDEVAGCLRYAAAIGPTLYATAGSTRTGTLAVAATDPCVDVVVEAGATVVVRDGSPPDGAVVLRGRAVDLVEALTFRAPLEADVDPGDRWLLGGLAQAFDLATP